MTVHVSVRMEARLSLRGSAPLEGFLVTGAEGPGEHQFVWLTRLEDLTTLQHRSPPIPHPYSTGSCSYSSRTTLIQVKITLYSRYIDNGKCRHRLLKQIGVIFYHSPPVYPLHPPQKTPAVPLGWLKILHAFFVSMKYNNSFESLRQRCNMRQLIKKNHKLKKKWFTFTWMCMKTRTSKVRVKACQSL